jgi:hypothetical protein
LSIDGIEWKICMGAFANEDSPGSLGGKATPATDSDSESSHDFRFSIIGDSLEYRVLTSTAWSVQIGFFLYVKTFILPVQEVLTSRGG